MATVYLAQSNGRTGAHRFVAVKCIRPELARNPQFVEMFLDEARVAGQIRHPNVCSVLDFSEHHGTHYIAMEFLSGQTLAAVQREASANSGKPMAIAAIFARILEGACEGVHAAHEAVSSTGTPLNVVHRDISPDNVFVTYEGNVKLMDFGVSASTNHLHKTRTGFLKGKSAYLAPEILDGDKPDRRTDVWGLGVVAWEMLTQRRLFVGSSDPAILHAITNMEIEPPSALVPGLPPMLDEIVMRALERDPARRYTSARELGRMLNRFLVEYGHVVGVADVADFMTETFPEGLTYTRQLLRVADQVKAAPPTRARGTPTLQQAPLTPAAMITVADAAVAESLARSIIPATPSSEPASTATPALTAPAPPRRRLEQWLLGLVPVVRRPRPNPWFLGAALLMAFVCGSVVSCLSTYDHPSDPLAGFTLEATPAGVDSTGAILLRVKVVRTSDK